MVNELRPLDSHVGDLLSGYIDGELTQQQRQRVTLHCEDCADCQRDLEELLALRERLGKTQFTPAGKDQWREKMDDQNVNLLQGIGWIMLIAGAIGFLLLFVHILLFDPGLSVGEKLLFFAFYGGLGALLASVIRQRMIESKTDKYNDVEI